MTQDNCSQTASLKKELGLAASASAAEMVRKACRDLSRIQKRIQPHLSKP